MLLRQDTKCFPILSKLCVLAFLFFAPSCYSGNNVYMLTVKVDVTRASSLKAKEEAFDIARQKAFHKLLSRLILQKDCTTFKGATIDQITPLIKSFTVKKEQHSGIRYIATLQFQFHPNKVRSLLEKNEIPFSETGTVRLALLPILIKDGQFILWEEEENLWYQAWQKPLENEGDVHVVCPLSDLEDQIILPLKDLHDLKKPMLEALKKRYKSDDVLLALLSIEKQASTEEEPLKYRGSVRYIPFALKNIQEVQTLGTFSFSEDLPAALQTLRGKIISDIRDKWKKVYTRDHKVQRSVKMRMPLTSIQSWQSTLQKIKSIEAVQRVEVIYFTKKETSFFVHFSGKFKQLKEKLAAEGFSLDLQDGVVILGA